MTLRSKGGGFRGGYFETTSEYGIKENVSNLRRG